MFPLLLCSFTSLALVLHRILWGPRRQHVIPSSLLKEVEHLSSLRKYEELIGICKTHPSALAQIMLAAFSNLHKPREEKIDAIELAGRRVVASLQRYLGTLGTIAAISPLLGLLGTVFGMIATFTAIQTHGVGNAPALAGGISEALITTAFGLSIAIPTLIFYRYFMHQTQSLTLEMEEIALKTLENIEDLNTENNYEVFKRAST